MKNLLGLTPEYFYKHVDVISGIILEKELCEIITKFIRKVVLFSQKSGCDINECIARYESDLTTFNNKSSLTAVELAKSLIIQRWNTLSIEKMEPGRHAPLLTNPQYRISRQEKKAA